MPQSCYFYFICSAVSREQWAMLYGHLVRKKELSPYWETGSIGRLRYFLTSDVAVYSAALEYLDINGYEYEIQDFQIRIL